MGRYNARQSRASIVPRAVFRRVPLPSPVRAPRRSRSCRGSRSSPAPNRYGLQPKIFKNCQIPKFDTVARLHFWRRTNLPVPVDIEALGPTPVPFSLRYKLHSDKVGAKFVIDIALPPPYLTASGPLPILFVTDGNMAFPTAAATAAILPIEPGGPRPICVVGIGYELAGQGERGEHLVLRNRDLTPLRDESWEMRMRAAPPPFRFGSELQTGGGDRFLDFIVEELKPWLVATFPVDADNCTLAGTSFGATLALHAMFTRPGAFARHLAISPS